MNITVFCGSRAPHNPHMAQVTIQFAQWAATHGHTLITGGATSGVMQLVSTTHLQHGGNLTIIYPQKMTHHASLSHPNLTHIVTSSLHTRLEEMTTRADCFVALPGGLGTLHELAQVWADTTLGNYHKPIHILNLEGFYNGFFSFMDHTRQTGYTTVEHMHLLTSHANLPSLLSALEQ